jgi:hypothetical protein
VRSPAEEQCNFGFQEPWKKAREIFQGLEKTPRALSNPWKFCRRA